LSIIKMGQYENGELKETISYLRRAKGYKGEFSNLFSQDVRGWTHEGA